MKIFVVLLFVVSAVHVSIAKTSQTCSRTCDFPEKELIRQIALFPNLQDAVINSITRLEGNFKNTSVCEIFTPANLLPDDEDEDDDDDDNVPTKRPDQTSGNNPTEVTKPSTPRTSTQKSSTLAPTPKSTPTSTTLRASSPASSTPKSSSPDSNDDLETPDTTEVENIIKNLPTDKQIPIDTITKEQPKTVGDALSIVDPKLGEAIKKYPDLNVGIDTAKAIPELQAEAKKNGGRLTIITYFRILFRYVKSSKGQDPKHLLRFFRFFIRVTKSQPKMTGCFKGLVPQKHLNNFQNLPSRQILSHITSTVPKIFKGVSNVNGLLGGLTGGLLGGILGGGKQVKPVSGLSGFSKKSNLRRGASLSRAGRSRRGF